MSGMVKEEFVVKKERETVFELLSPQSMKSLIYPL